ncbi:MAG TPA: hypothetical protein VGX72_09055 [Solirubrobacteraceae bacterium]|jgi:hypothetical protein|nr:hypothetical protein [Solirubrobacteraceae bacterium]
MNTIHVARPLNVNEGRAALYARTIGLTALLCAAVFACCFLIGRAERPTGARGEQLSASPIASNSGPAIPIRLANAPRIHVEAPPVVASPAAKSSAPAASKTPPASQPALVSAVPAASAPVAATPTAPVAHVTPVSPRRQTPSVAPSSRPSRGTSGGAKGGPSGSTSFDSSG